ncbi:hypothetical protein [Helicobacter pylori]|uniref:hypothetical protein n=1 Tax=Helicobacter pylori TaxID=210 RepID=UPI001F0983CD|nr:hypothetical protein [Helicobacter pylori]
MTKVDAIKKVMEDNKGIVSWTILYNQIEKYYLALEPLKNGRLGLEGYYTERLEIIKILKK